MSTKGHIHSLCDPASAVSFANLLSIWSPFYAQILSHFLTRNESLLLSGSSQDLAWLMRPSTSCWSVWLYLRSLSHKHSSPTSPLKFIEHLLCVGSCAGSSTYIISSVPPIGLPWALTTTWNHFPSLQLWVPPTVHGFRKAIHLHRFCIGLIGFESSLLFHLEAGLLWAYYLTFQCLRFLICVIEVTIVSTLS